MDQLTGDTRLCGLYCVCLRILSLKGPLSIPQSRGTSHFGREFSLVFQAQEHLKPPGGRAVRGGNLKEGGRLSQQGTGATSPNITYQYVCEAHKGIWPRILTSAHVFECFDRREFGGPRATALYVLLLSTQAYSRNSILVERGFLTGG